MDLGMRLKHPEVDTLGEVWAFVADDLLWTLTSAGIIALVMAYFVHTRRLLRRQLAELEAVARDYDEESRFEMSRL